jgi:putative sterol carrier protein
MTSVAEEIVAGLTQNINPSGAIGGTIKVDMGQDGSIIIDGRSAPASLIISDDAADCTMTCSSQTFVGLMDGSIDGMKAFMTGKLKISGKDSLVDQMDQLFKA